METASTSVSFTDQRERLLKLQEALEEAYPSHYTKNQYHITVRKLNASNVNRTFQA